MKKYLVFIALFCASCVNEPVKTEEPLGPSLETQKDLIAAIETYNNKYKGCRCLNSSIFCNGDGRSWDKCDTSLRRTDVQYKCFETVGNGYVKYIDETDECILHRRDIKESSINFFDFSRFIPEGTIIKTEEDFKLFAEFYELGTYKCNTLDETTTEEKKQCISTIQNYIKEISHNKIPKCNQMDIFKEDYKSLLADIIKILWRGAKNAAYQEAKTYAREHLCDVSDYLKDASDFPGYLKKAGF